MATKKTSDRTALICDDCSVEIFVDDNMVMLNDELWKEISDKHEDSYCDDCIEKRMNRPIEVADFKPISGMDITGTGLIPCNAFWLYYNRPEEYLKLKK